MVSWFPCLCEVAFLKLLGENVCIPSELWTLGEGVSSLVCNISEQPLVQMLGCGHVFLFRVGARRDFRQLYSLSLVVIWSCIRFLFSFQSVRAHLFLGSLSFTFYFQPVGRVSLADLYGN